MTEEVGLEANNTRYTMAAAWEDYDNDGDLDLYVANDFGRNCLYQNSGGHFLDVADVAGVEDIGAGMSVSFADYNHDSNMASLLHFRRLSTSRLTDRPRMPHGRVRPCF